MTTLRAVGAIVLREFRRFVRQRGRLLSTVARPLLWLFVVGSGFSGIVATTADLSYRDYLLPGVIGMVILFSAMLAALSTVYDRELGIARMMLVAPVRRVTVVVAKVVSSAVLAAGQGLALFVLVPVLGLGGEGAGLGTAAAGVVGTSFTLAAIGMLLASRIGSLENFAVVMNFVVFPMFFLSGALYPVARLPEVLQVVARANPLTYGVDLLKHGFFGPGRGAFGGEITPWVDLAVLAAWTVGATLLAGWWFGREDRFTRVATSSGG